MSNLGAIWADNHDMGSGLHLHVSWFQKGGIVDRAMRKKGKKGGKGRAKKLKKLDNKGLSKRDKARLERSLRAINFKDEEITLAKREHESATSDAGTEISDKELQEQIELYREKLGLKRNRYNILTALWSAIPGQLARQRKLKAKKGSPRAKAINEGIKGLRSARDTVRKSLEDLIGLTGFRGSRVLPLDKIWGGTYGETRFQLRELGFTETSDSRRNAEIADLLRQQLTESQRALAVSESQMPIFQQFLPKYHQGGVIQGPRGSEQPVMAQSGEGIFTPDQMAAMGRQNVTVVIEDGAVDSDRIRLEVDGVLQEKVSMVRRQPSRRRY
jgi:hypothetical protein